MAQKVRIVLIDDFDGSAASETVKFGLDGVQYEIDLSIENATKLREKIQPYALKARRITSKTQRSRNNSATNHNAEKNRETAEIRRWAKESGYKISKRGRISADIRQMYIDTKSA